MSLFGFYNNQFFEYENGFLISSLNEGDVCVKYFFSNKNINIKKLNLSHKIAIYIKKEYL